MCTYVHITIIMYNHLHVFACVCLRCVCIYVVCTCVCALCTYMYACKYNII